MAGVISLGKDTARHKDHQIEPFPEATVPCGSGHDLVRLCGHGGQRQGRQPHLLVRGQVWAESADPDCKRRWVAQGVRQLVRHGWGRNTADVLEKWKRALGTTGRVLHTHVSAYTHL